MYILQASNVFNASEVDPLAVDSILQDLVVATTPSASNPVSQFPRDLATTNDVVDLTVNYLRRNLESGTPTDLSTVSSTCTQLPIVINLGIQITNIRPCGITTEGSVQ